MRHFAIFRRKTVEGPDPFLAGVPQRLTPGSISVFAARLKPCP